MHSGFGLAPGAAVPGEFTSLVCQVLNPVLEKYGFAAGQGGQTGNQATVIFCAPQAAFAERFAETAFDEQAVGDGFCVDLTVEGMCRDRWHVIGVRLNGLWFSILDLHSDTLPEEINYTAAHLAAMLDGTSPVEWAPRGWSPE